MRVLNKYKQPGHGKQFLPLPLICLSLMLACCTGGANRDGLNTIDSLQSVLATLNRKIDGLDHPGMETALKRYAEHDLFFRRSFHDAMSHDIAILLSQYRAAAKPPGKYMANRERFLRELRFCQTQLSDLKRTIEEHTAEQTKLPEFLDTEAAAVRALSEYAPLIDNLEKQVEKLNALSARVDRCAALQKDLPGHQPL
mgnify:CR=1 FL=1